MSAGKGHAKRMPEAGNPVPESSLFERRAADTGSGVCAAGTAGSGRERIKPQIDSRIGGIRAICGGSDHCRGGCERSERDRTPELSLWRIAEEDAQVRRAVRARSKIVIEMLHFDERRSVRKHGAMPGQPA